MLILSYLRDIFSLDTLDTRLTSPPARPRHGTDINVTTTKHPREVTGTPPRWNSIEFYGYYLFLAFILPLMFQGTYSVSRGM